MGLVDKFLQRLIPFASLQLPDNCLIPISLVMDGRGSASKYSIICLPKRCDLRENVKKLKLLDFTPIHTEPIKADTSETQRKQLRLKHQSLLKRLRRRRVRIKRKLQETSHRKVKIFPARTAGIVAKQLETMSELWLPSKPTAIRNQCSREVFGYLTQCQFNFIEARVAGIGYVTAKGLEALIKNSPKTDQMHKVLVRDPNSLNYRFAILKLR